MRAALLLVALRPRVSRSVAVTTTFQSLIFAPDAESSDWFGGGVTHNDEFLIVGAEKESEAAAEAGESFLRRLNYCNRRGNVSMGSSP